MSSGPTLTRRRSTARAGPVEEQHGDPQREADFIPVGEGAREQWAPSANTAATTQVGTASTRATARYDGRHGDHGRRRRRAMR
jgi:hypothetical protein